MNSIEIAVTFRPKKLGSTKGTLTVRQGQDLLHSDVLDIAKAKDRTPFLNKLEKLCPGIDIDEVRQTILSEVDRSLKEENTVESNISKELDIRSIVRPDIFHTPEISGIMVPVAHLVNGDQLTGKWQLYIQWANGKRGCVDIADYIECGDGEKLWFHPKPISPSPNTQCQWSAHSRKKWLAGYTPDLNKLFHQLHDAFNYFLEFSDDDICTNVTLTIWTMLTYVYPAWPAVPYLSIGGPLGSGKSRVFEVLSRVVLRPLPSSNMTSACLFRTLHLQGGILLLDEAERLRDRTPDVGETLSILLAGYKRGSKAHRLEKVGDGFQPVSFDVYGPKAIAAIGSLPSALVSRCIKIMMFRAGKKSLIPARRIDENRQRWLDLCDDLHAMALSYGKSFVEISSWQPKYEGLNGRDLELWQPIIAIAKLMQDNGVNGLIDVVEEHIAKSLESRNDDVVPEADEIVLRLLKEELDDNPMGITASELLVKAKEEDGSLFLRYSPRGIGAILNRYGIKSHRSGGKRYYSPTNTQFRAIEESYGIDLGVENDTELS